MDGIGGDGKNRLVFLQMPGDVTAHPPHLPPADDEGAEAVEIVTIAGIDVIKKSHGPRWKRKAHPQVKHRMAPAQPDGAAAKRQSVTELPIF